MTTFGYIAAAISGAIAALLIEHFGSELFIIVFLAGVGLIGCTFPRT